MVAFASPVEALRSSVEMQRAMAAHGRDHPDRAVEIRVGLHVGDPPREEGDFFGMAVVVARRLCDRAAGRQILASELLTGVAGNRAGTASAASVASPEGPGRAGAGRGGGMHRRLLEWLEPSRAQSRR